jgi:hypothetical protein
MVFFFDREVFKNLGLPWEKYSRWFSLVIENVRGVARNSSKGVEKKFFA